jgi:hypothetical protein
LLSNYTVTLNGVAQTYPDIILYVVVVTAPGSGNTAVLSTNDTYIGSDGQPHETTGGVSLGATLQGTYPYVYYTQSSGFIFMLDLSGFDNNYAYLGPNDGGRLVATPCVQNTFVSAGSYSYLENARWFGLISGGLGVTGYGANSNDVAYQYDGSGPSTYTVYTTGYSTMTGTDNGQPFDNEAYYFNVQYGIAQHPGQDTAVFVASYGDYIFVGNTYTSYLYSHNPDGSIADYEVADGFAEVDAYVYMVGTDYAYNYDPQHVHTYGFIVLT